MQARQLAGVQWLRGAAALLVVVGHSLLTLIEKAGADPSLGRPGVLLGGTGVKLFFLVSGLVMVMSSLHSFGAAPARDFMRRRLIRIVPLYWLTTFIYLIKLHLTGTEVIWPDVVKSFLFVPFANSAGEMQPIYGLGWTLNYEIFFYTVFCLGIYVSRSATLLGTGTVLGFLILVGTSMTISPTDTLFHQVLYFCSRPITLFFLMGMFLAVALRRLAIETQGFGIPLRWAIGIASALIAWGMYFSSSFKPSNEIELALFGAPVFVVALGKVGARNSWLADTSKRLGDASYSIYLTHSFVIGPLGRIADKLGGVPTPVFVSASLLIATGVGVLTYLWIERPLLKWLTVRTNAPA